MKIILEGTEAELISALGSFGIPNEVIFDDEKEFVPFACSDLASRGHRQKCNHAFKGSDIDADFIPIPNAEETKALMKEHAKRRRQVYRQLHSNESKELKEALETIDDMIDSDMPKVVSDYLDGKKILIIFGSR